MKTVFVILGMTLALSVQAEVLNLPEPGQQPTVDRSTLPKRGSSMATVKAKHGEPLGVSGPVGDPPITRWDYGSFIVFFEYQHVINSVVPNRPPKIHHMDELRPGQ